MNRFVLLVILLQFFVGCSPLDTTRETGTVETFPVIFLDDDIETALSLIDHRSERLPSGHVNVTLLCMSKKEKKAVWIEWKVVFSDNRNVDVEESEWHTEALPPRLEKTLQIGSLRKDVSSFHFLIRTPLR